MPAHGVVLQCFAVQNAFIKYIVKLGQIRHFLVASPAALPLTFFAQLALGLVYFVLAQNELWYMCRCFPPKYLPLFFSLFISVYCAPPLSTWTRCANDRLISTLLAPSPCAPVPVHVVYLCIYGRVISANYLRQFLCIFYFWNCALLFPLYATPLSFVFHNGVVIVVAKWIYLILVIFFSWSEFA